jgi:hypothetical protein
MPSVGGFIAIFVHRLIINICTCICALRGPHTKDFTVGLATEFFSEKIPRNRLGTVYVIPRKKVLIPRNSEVYGRFNSEARKGTELQYKKISFTKNPDLVNRTESVFSSAKSFGTEFRVVFSSAVWFRKEFREFASIFDVTDAT